MADTVSTYAARRRQFLPPGVWREPGELVPEFHLVRRVDSSLHTGYIVQVDVSRDELTEAIERYCPEQSDAIWRQIDSTRQGPHATPADLSTSQMRPPALPQATPQRLGGAVPDRPERRPRKPVTVAGTTRGTSTTPPQVPPGLKERQIARVSHGTTPLLIPLRNLDES